MNLLEVNLASNKAAVANFEVHFNLPFNRVFCDGMRLPWDSVCTGPDFAACAREESFKESLCDGYSGHSNCTSKTASFPINDSVSQFSVIVTGAPVSTTQSERILNARIFILRNSVSVLLGMCN